MDTHAHLGYTRLQPKSRTHKRHSFVLACLAVLLYGNIVRVSSTFWSPSGSALQQTTVTAVPANRITATYAPTTSPGADTLGEADLARQVQAAQATTNQPTTTAVEANSSCTGTPFSMPAPTELTTAANGLTKTIDSPTYYQVYGNSVKTVRQAIADCPYRAAAGSYQAATSYQLNWSYSTARLANNSCSLTNVRIGLHINQIMPSFTPTNATPASLIATWQSFSTNLSTHEAGHIAIDTQYAEKIVASLQTINSVGCGTIGNQTQTTIDSFITMLNGANDLYDAQTNHGATQGAVL